eukprot:jgi/Astpho2/3557/fgenesh1_pg.00057_%23_34_t
MHPTLGIGGGSSYEDGLHAALSNSLLGLKSAAQVLANLPTEAAQSETVSLDHSKLREQVQLWVQCACCLLSQAWELSSMATHVLQDTLGLLQAQLLQSELLAKALLQEHGSCLLASAAALEVCLRAVPALPDERQAQAYEGLAQTLPYEPGLSSTVAALLAHTQRQLQRHLTGLEQGSHLQAQLPGLLHLSLEAVHAAATLPRQERRQGFAELCTSLLALAQGLLRFVQDPARLTRLLNNPCRPGNSGTDLIGMLTGCGSSAQQSDATAAASALQRQQQIARLLQKLLEALLQGVLQGHELSAAGTAEAHQNLMVELAAMHGALTHLAERSAAAVLAPQRCHLQTGFMRGLSGLQLLKMLQEVLKGSDQQQAGPAAPRRRSASNTKKHSKAPAEQLASGRPGPSQVLYIVSMARSLLEAKQDDPGWPAVDAPVTSLCADSAVSGAVRAIRQAKLAPASPQAPRQPPQGLPSTNRRRRRLSMAAPEAEPHNQEAPAASQPQGQSDSQPEHGGQPAKRHKVARAAPCTGVLEQPAPAALSDKAASIGRSAHSQGMPASAEQVCGAAAGTSCAGQQERKSACAAAGGRSQQAEAVGQPQTQAARDDTAEVAPPDNSPTRASTPTSSPGSPGKRTKAQARLQGLALQSGTPIPGEGLLKEAPGTAAGPNFTSQSGEQAYRTATAEADGAAQSGRRLGDEAVAAQSVLPLGPSSGGQAAAAASAGHAGASISRAQGAVDPRRIAPQAVEGQGSAAQQSQPLSLAEQAREAGSAAAAAAGSGSREHTHPSAVAREASSQCASDPAASVAAQAEASGQWSGAGATESAAAEDDDASSSSSMATGSDVGSASDEDSDVDSENLEEAAAALGEDQEAWWQDFIASKEQLLTVLQDEVPSEPEEAAGSLTPGRRRSHASPAEAAWNPAAAFAGCAAALTLCPAGVHAGSSPLQPKLPLSLEEMDRWSEWHLVSLEAMRLLVPALAVLGQRPPLDVEEMVWPVLSLLATVNERRRAAELGIKLLEKGVGPNKHQAAATVMYPAIELQAFWFSMQQELTDEVIVALYCAAAAFQLHAGRDTP